MYGEHYKKTWPTASLLAAMICSLISCIQINAAVINLRNLYIRD